MLILWTFFSVLGVTVNQSGIQQLPKHFLELKRWFRKKYLHNVINFTRTVCTFCFSYLLIEIYVSDCINRILSEISVFGVYSLPAKQTTQGYFQWITCNNVPVISILRATSQTVGCAPNNRNPQLDSICLSAWTTQDEAGLACDIGW